MTPEQIKALIETNERLWAANKNLIAEIERLKKQVEQLELDCSCFVGMLEAMDD